MSKHILLISYVFPPYPGIGGRRWAKFAKYLSKKGYIIHVICAKSAFKDSVSNWEKDVAEDKSIIRHYMPALYPQSLLIQPKSIAEKLSYRLDYYLLKINSKGNIYDRSVKWKKQLLTTAASLIQKHKIKNVISSGGPFHLLAHTTELKKSLPDLNVIIDFRDPWTDNQSFWGFSSLTPKRRAYEQSLEEYAIENADFVTTVAEEMTENLQKRTKQNPHKFKTINNGFDYDDLSAPSILKTDSSQIRLIFTGTLYGGLEEIFFKFLQSLKEIKLVQPDLYKRLSIDFFGGAPKHYIDKAKEFEIDIIHFKGVIPLKEVYSEIASSNICMLFLNDDFTFSMSTKFFEYLGMQKKIAVFSKPGFLAEYVTQNEIGYGISPETLKQDFLAMIKKGSQNNFAFNEKFNSNQFSIEALTSKLESLFV